MMGTGPSASNVDAPPAKVAAAKTSDPTHNLSAKKGRQPSPSRNQNGDLDLAKEATVERTRSRPHGDHDTGGRPTPARTVDARPTDRPKGKKSKPVAVK